MNQPLSSRSLAQIVNSNHRAASVFEKYHLDFCCKGKRSLAEACLEQRVELSHVEGELGYVFSKAATSGLGNKIRDKKSIKLVHRLKFCLSSFAHLFHKYFSNVSVVFSASGHELAASILHLTAIL